MQVYLVGGAVRDELLGISGADRDFVVVGATIDEMRAQGFAQVGQDFPVFLHPETHEEYALARTERKHGHGYTGFICDFSPKTTLEEDLLRRLLSRTDDKRHFPEIVCTGRDPQEWLTACADYVTRMECVKHPFDRGIGARKGIEY